MSTANRVIKNTGYLYAKILITAFISIYTTRIILGSLGAADFGVYSVVGGAIGILGFFNVALSSATQRFMSYSNGEGDLEKQKKIFNISFIMHHVLSVIVGLALIAAGQFFFICVFNLPPDRIDAAKVVYASLIVSTMFSVMSVPYTAVLTAHENMLYYSVVNVIESLLRLGVAFVTVYTFMDKLIVYGILMAAIPLISLTVMRVYCHHRYVECVVAPRRYWDRKLLKEMTSFAGYNLFSSSGQMVGNYASPMILNNFFGVLLNTALGVASQLSGMMLSFSNSMLNALRPAIIKKGATDRAAMLAMSYTGCKFGFSLFAIFCLPVFIEAPFVLRIWLKNIPEWAILFVRFQIVCSLLGQMTSSLYVTLSAVGKIKGYSLFNLVVFLLPLPVLYLAFGMGASPAWYYPVLNAFTVGFDAIGKLYFCRRHCSLSVRKFSKSVILPCILIALVVLTVGSVVRVSMDEGWLRLIICVCVTTIVLSLSCFATMNKLERQTIRNVVTKIVKHS